MTIRVDEFPASSGVQGYTLDADLPTPALPPVPVYTPAYFKDVGPGSPAWYLTRLLAKLDVRSQQMMVWDNYYSGVQPLAFASDKFREAFGGRFRAFSSNFMALVVDGTRERMEVTGFTLPSQRATKKAWRIWQDNDMDASSQIAHTEALIKGVAYTLVDPQRFASPRITVEDPLDAITESDPRDRRIRRAGLKRWVDDEQRLVVYLYFPDVIWKLRSQAKWERGGAATLEPYPQEDESFPTPNPLGLVPLVPLINRPRLHGSGQSEIDSVMSNQDAVNKYRADALVAAEFAAFRQRWAIGLDIPKDPETGQPIEPFKAAVDRLWVVPPPDPEDPNPSTASFGEFSATDLSPYQRMIESEVGAISSISRLPYHYLLGQPQAVPPSGESLKSSEAGLISKVKTQLIHFGEGWEETIRLALIAVGDSSGADRTSQTEWRDPETRNEGVRTDATVKAYTSGIIDRNEARAALGYQPVEDVETPEVPDSPATEDADEAEQPA